ncbi:MAG: hypothetical protein QM235_11765 [Pseudomonadota bacterium]|jgi:hypothetical protein|nr:hypothetical protein [Pseudomonadota bacterium]
MNISELRYDTIIVKQHDININRFRVIFDEVIVNINVSYNAFKHTAKSTQHGYILKGIYSSAWELVIGDLIDFAKFLSIMQLFLKNQLPNGQHKVNERLMLMRDRLVNEEVLTMLIDKKKMADFGKIDIQHYVNILNKLFNKLILAPPVED